MTNDSRRHVFGATTYRTLCAGAALAFVITTATSSELIKREDGIYEYTDPTEAEIAAGEALASRIARTAEQVPISDVNAWFAALGISDWSIRNSPGFFRFVAQTRNNTQTAFRSVAPGIEGAAIQIVGHEPNPGSERIEITLNRAEICLTVEQVKRTFSPRAEAIRHIVPRYQYGGALGGFRSAREGERLVGRFVQKGEYDYLVFVPDKLLWPTQPFVRVGYGHQACASNVTVSYGEHGSCNRDGISMCVIDTTVWHSRKD